MKSVHLLVPDLFLPADIASDVCKGLRLPALEMLLARGVLTGVARSGACEAAPENRLCELFGVKIEADAPVAPISALFDGLGTGCWLRADPVHLHLDQSRMLLSPVTPRDEEAAAMCASLNEYFSGQGMVFFAPHPQRWYVRLDALPRIINIPLSQAIGSDVRGSLPTGEDAAHWHGIFNEIQMLMFSHPVNDARAARGEMPVNSVWLWGGGDKAAPASAYDSVASDDILPEMFAAAAGIRFMPWGERWCEESGSQLLVWTGLRSALQRGDLAAWRGALQDFETGYVQPLWRALRAGNIERLEIDVVGGVNAPNLRLKRTDSWAFWRGSKPLAQYSIV